jgi:hypothetical protein
MTRIVLLGPQRLRKSVMQEPSVDSRQGTVAAITAGWQDRELEDGELREALGGDVCNLRLHGRWERVVRTDPDFAAAHRRRQDQLRRLQEIYRQRLAPLMDTCRALLARKDDPELVDPETADVIESIRRLDAFHVERTDQVQQAFDARHPPDGHPEVAREREQILGVLKGCRGLAIAGGHVAVLQNRLKLFGLEPVLNELPVVAWSAGAMVLCERIVLFHDSPPQGAGDAEVLGRGFGLVAGVVVLPHARHRLRLADQERVATMARRFAPARCLPLDEGARVAWDGRRLRLDPNTRVLAATGEVEATK